MDQYGPNKEGDNGFGKDRNKGRKLRGLTQINLRKIYMQ